MTKVQEYFDCAVIGGGPGGYVAAIRAAQLGATVVCFDNSPLLGGTCLNVGCIPSKSLLHISHEYRKAASEISDYGISCAKVTFDLKQVMSYKEQKQNKLGLGVTALLQKNKVKFVKAAASFIDRESVEAVTANGERSTLYAKNFIIATGSTPATIPGVEVDEEIILSSTGALSLQAPPKQLVIIGGGVIGIELGSVWSRFGSEVIVLDNATTLLPGYGTDVGTEALRFLTAQGLKFELGVTVKSIKRNGQSATIHYSQHGQEKVIEGADKVLIAVGRKPNTAGLNLDQIGVSMEPNGCITVDQNLRTNIKNIYAIGDVIKGPMLAHKASEEGIAAAECICKNRAPSINYDIVPNVIYTYPEIASVGKTEKQLQDKQIDYKAGKIPFRFNSRSVVCNNEYGFVKVLVCPRTDTILGASIIAPNASEMIAEVAVAMAFYAAAEDVELVPYAHPTLSEAIREACAAANERAIHG